MRIPRVKICGITTPQDALLAVEAGADAIGLMLYPASPRFVTVKMAREICGELPPFVTAVGVFVNEAREEIVRTVDRCGLGCIQLHGDESPEFCDGFAQRVVKAVRVKDSGVFSTLGNYRTSAYLLDSYVADKLGGTGERFNWNLAVEAKKFGKPIILAGGLNPSNAALATTTVQPYGLDVSSGVESSPGKKDPEKVKAFIRSVREAALSISSNQLAEI